MADVEIEGATETAEVVTTLANSNVVSKYRESAIIAQQALDGILTQLVPGTRVVEICKIGDALIEKLVAPLYKNKKSMEKGIAFPTCVSVNTCVAHYSPLESEDKLVLAAGDSVKIDLGVHLDGFIAVVAHTVVVGASSDSPVTGPRADVITAAHHAAEIAVRMLKEGAENYDITAAIARVAEAYGVTPVSGVLSHELKQLVIDGPRVILQKEEPDAKVEHFTFGKNDAFAIDICFSTGEGKPKEASEGASRTTVFKRAIENNYNLKMQTARALLTAVNKRAPFLPFSLRSLISAVEKGETGVRAGVTEPISHGMLHPYPVLVEKAGAEVAHFKFTALQLPGGTLKVTGKDLPDYIKSEKSLPEDLAALLHADSHSSSKKKKSKKAAKAAPAEGEMDVETA